MKTTAPNSVFALAGAGAGADDPDAANSQADEGAGRAADWIGLARDCFEACGELTVVQLQEALGCTRSRANTTLSELRDAGTVVQLRKDGMAPVYGLAGGSTTGGIKGWLQRRAASDAGAPAPRKGRGKARSAAQAPRTKRSRTEVAIRPAAPASATLAELVPLPKAPPQPDLKLGLFSDGSLTVEADGQVLRLDAARTRRLIDSLLRFDAVLNTGGFC